MTTVHGYIQQLLEAAEAAGFLVMAWEPERVRLYEREREGLGQEVEITGRDPLAILRRIKPPPDKEQQP